MSKVPDVELTDIKEIVAAAEVEKQAAKLIHDWQIDQLGKIGKIGKIYISKFKVEIERQPDGETMAENCVSREMITFIATVMAKIAFQTIDEQICTLSRMIGALDIDTLRKKEPYEVLSEGDKVVVDIDTFFNTEKIKMATPLLNDLEKLSPKKPKNKKKGDDRCVISGGSKRRKSIKSTNSIKSKKSNKTKNKRKIRRTRKSRV
jgi:hypothetical protein